MPMRILQLHDSLMVERVVLFCVNFMSGFLPRAQKHVRTQCPLNAAFKTIWGGPVPELVCYRVVSACVLYILKAAFKTICEAPVLQLVCYRMVPACAQYCLRAAFKTVGEAPMQHLVCYHIASAYVQ